MRSIRPLAISLGLTLGVGFLGALSTSSQIETWYVTINKPSFSPPNWIFGPVWTLLYIAMAVAAWRVFEARPHPLRRIALASYGGHLLINAAWSYVFFGFESPESALVVIIGLLGLIVAVGTMFYLIDRKAGILFVPYFLWVCFATVLNASIVSLN